VRLGRRLNATTVCLDHLQPQNNEQIKILWTVKISRIRHSGCTFSDIAAIPKQARRKHVTWQNFCFVFFVFFFWLLPPPPCFFQSTPIYQHIAHTLFFSSQSMRDHFLEHQLCLTASLVISGRTVHPGPTRTLLVGFWAKSTHCVIIRDGRVCIENTEVRVGQTIRPPSKI